MMTWGVARVDITPPIGVTLMGYEPRLSTHIDHPLRAEALACGSEAGGWILLSADLGAFTSVFTDPVRTEIARRTGLPPEAVVVAATHTHSGPHVTDAYRCERSEQESAYVRTLHRRLVEVAVRAWENREPGTWVYAETAAPGLASNRRVQRADGTWANEWRDPEGRHTGYCDPAVDVSGVRRKDGTLSALLLHFGCHPVGFGKNSTAISGDYVSYLKEALESSGQVDTVLFSVSGHANIDPLDAVQADPGAVRRMGEHLAGLVAAAIPRLEPVGGEGAGAVREPWSFETTWTIGGRLAIYFPHAGPGRPVHTALVALRAGNCALLGMPGEAVSEYREILRRRSPFTPTLLFSLANDFVGYLPTDDILEQGAYEAELCPVRPLQSALLARADAALRRLGKT